MYIGANPDLNIIIFNSGKTDKFIRILINDKIFFLNLEEKIIFSLTSEERFSGKLVENLSRKTTGIILVVITCYLLLFSNVTRVEAMGTSIVPQTPIVRILSSGNHQSSNIRQKKDKITLRDVWKIDPYFYLLSPEFVIQIDNEKVIQRALKNIRGGSFSEVAVGLVLLILILQLKGVGIEGFHIPIARPNGVISENSGPLAHAPHLNQKPGGRIRLRMTSSNQCRSDMTQISSFIKDGKVDLHQCHDEVLRRAAALGCENFECSFERFKSLATELGKIDDNSCPEWRNVRVF